MEENIKTIGLKVINLNEFVQRLVRSGMTDHTYIVSQIARFINQDREIETFIQGLLMSRLKYATGRLYRKTKVTATYNTTPIRQGQRIETVNAFLNIRLEVPDDLLNALLGEDEVKTPVPTVEALTKWIRSKQRYFNDKIVKMTKRAMERLAAQRQREILSKSKKFSIEKFRPQAAGVDSIDELAQQIQGAMMRRFEEHGSATLGSEYVFLGYSEGKKTVYKKFSRPLYTTKDASVVGEINEFFAKKVAQYYEGIISRISVGSIQEGGVPIARGVMSEMSRIQEETQPRSLIIREMATEIKRLSDWLNVWGDSDKKKTREAAERVRQQLVILAPRASSLLLHSKELNSKDIAIKTREYVSRISQMSASDFRR